MIDTTIKCGSCGGSSVEQTQVSPTSMKMKCMFCGQESLVETTAEPKGSNGGGPTSSLKIEVRGRAGSELAIRRLPGEIDDLERWLDHGVSDLKKSDVSLIGRHLHTMLRMSFWKVVSNEEVPHLIASLSDEGFEELSEWNWARGTFIRDRRGDVNRSFRRIRKYKKRLEAKRRLLDDHYSMVNSPIE